MTSWHGSSVWSTEASNASGHSRTRQLKAGAGTRQVLALAFCVPMSYRHPTISDCTSTASTLTGDANLLVLPNIDAANIAYNLLKTAAGGNIAVGPVLLGAAKPVHILTASTTVRRIVNMTALTVADANAIR